MSGRLVIAVPSKGRLQENASAFFARAGLPLSQEGGSRDYRGVMRDLPGVEVLFLSASEIVARLSSGEAHLGVTGEDLVREAIADADTRIVMLTPLGFGHADVVVAVPKGWIDASTMEDLEEIAADFHSRHGRRMRVATKYVNLTRRFFADHGVSDYRIVESLGATEGAPASGTAEFIVDITTTGSTLEANALKILDDGILLRSQANLVAALSADWSTETRALARQFLARISAEQSARTTRSIQVTAAAEKHDVLVALALDSGAALRSAGNTSPVVFEAPKAKAAAIASSLIAAGAGHVSVVENDYVFNARSPLADALDERLATVR